MDFVDIHGARLEVAHIAGDPAQPPIVFLHEGLGSVSMWQQRGQDWPRELCAATGRAGWVYSRRGYGQSDPVADVRGPAGQTGGRRHGRLSPDYMHHEALEVLPALLTALDMERPVLLGHSDGGTIALIHASRFELVVQSHVTGHMFGRTSGRKRAWQSKQGNGLASSGFVYRHGVRANAAAFALDFGIFHQRAGRQGVTDFDHCYLLGGW